MAKLVVRCCCLRYFEATPELLQRELMPHPPDGEHIPQCCRCVACDDCVGCESYPECQRHRLTTVLECEGYDCQGCLVPDLHCRVTGRKAKGVATRQDMRKKAT